MRISDHIFCLQGDYGILNTTRQSKPCEFCIILINLLISRGCHSGSIGQGGLGGPSGSGDPDGPGGPGDPGGMVSVVRIVRMVRRVRVLLLVRVVRVVRVVKVVRWSGCSNDLRIDQLLILSLYCLIQVG